MTRTQRRTRIKSGLLMATAVICLITLFVLSLAIGSGGRTTTEAENYERLTYQTVTDGYLSDFVNANDQTRLSYRPTDGVIRTPQQFCAVFLGGDPVDGEETFLGGRRDHRRDRLRHLERRDRRPVRDLGLRRLAGRELRHPVERYLLFYRLHHHFFSRERSPHRWRACQPTIPPARMKRRPFRVASSSA